MRKAFALALLAGLVCFQFAVPVLAWPAAQGVQAVITSPGMNAVVRGRVLIQGSAAHANFWKYEVYIAPEPNTTNQWSNIGIHETQVVDGLLETWDTTAVPDGSYSILLRVVDKTGNYQEYYVRQVAVSNTQPTATPTPTQTKAPTKTLAPKDTPTLIVVQPTTDLAAPTPTATLVRPTVAPAVSLPGGLNLESWRDAFLMGAGAMGAIFLLVGLIFLIRRLF